MTLSYVTPEAAEFERFMRALDLLRNAVGEPLSNVARAELYACVYGEDPAAAYRKHYSLRIGPRSLQAAVYLANPDLAMGTVPSWPQVLHAILWAAEKESERA